MLSSAYNLTAILDLPLCSIFNFIKHAIEKEQEQAVWDLWKGLYPFMMMELIEFKPFDKYKNELIKPNMKYTNKTLEEIEKEMMDIVALYEKRK